MEGRLAPLATLAGEVSQWPASSERPGVVQPGAGDRGKDSQMLVTEEEARKRRCCSMPMACEAGQCMAWRWAGDGYERVKTRNLRADEVMMAKRLKTHPHELGHWKRPEGEPLPPPGGGWEPDGPMRESPGYLEGTFERYWIRPINRRGYCGLAATPTK